MKKLILQLLLVLLPIAYCLLPISAFSATVRIDPSTTTLASIKPFAVDVKIDDVADLYGLSFDVVFDPDLLKVVSFSEGGFLKSDGKPTTFLGTTTSGRLIIGMTRQGCVTGMNGGGELAEIVFKPKQPGTTTLKFESVSLFNSGTGSIPASASSSFVSISQKPINLFMNPSSTNLTSGHSFSLEIKADSVQDIYSASFDLVFDPNLLKVVSFSEGGLLNSDGKPTTFLATTTSGRAIIGITRQSEAGGVNGSGVLCSINFKARNSGEVILGFSNLSFKDSYGDYVAINQSQAKVNISPVNLKIVPGAVDILTERQFMVSVEASDVSDLYGVALDIAFDKNLLEADYGNIKEGNFLKENGQPTVFNRAIKDDRVVIGITREGRVAGVSGTGTLCSFTFKAKGSGTTSMVLQNISLKDSVLDEADISAEQAKVNIVPTQIKIEPAQVELKLERQGTMSVMVYDQLDLYSASFDLVFGSNTIGSFTVQNGGFLSRDGKSVSLVATVTDGRLVVGITRQGVVPGISGNGRLLIISFWSIGTPTCFLSFENLHMENSKLMFIAVQSGTASVSVSDTKARSIKGKILSLSNNSVKDLQVELVDSSFRTTTRSDSNGAYIFEAPQAGSYELKVTDKEMKVGAKVQAGKGEEKIIDFAIGNEAEVAPDLEMTIEKDGTRLIFGSETFFDKVAVGITEPDISLAIQPVTIREIKLSGTDTTLKKEAILEIPYPIGYQNPEDLRIFRLNPDLLIWNLVGGEIDRDRGVVKVGIAHFSIFGLIPLQTAFNAPLEKVYPNPCKGDKVCFWFNPAPAKCTIKIYNIAGELIRTLNDTNEWYVSNVASGVYIYVAKGEGWEKRGKIGVIK
jgi:hypothetical protein